jgi:hypothetical protein
MVFVLRRQGLLGQQELDKRFQFFEVFAPLLKPFDVAVKLGRIGRGPHYIPSFLKRLAASLA